MYRIKPFAFETSYRAKNSIKQSILEIGARYYQGEIKLCISTKGVSPFLAFLADAGDITRFKTSEDLTHTCELSRQ